MRINIYEALRQLGDRLAGDLHTGEMMRRLYATDASVYRELPLAVATPENAEDIKKLIVFAGETQTSLIPRAAGTSLAGQCVGSGIVVDVSRHMCGIIELNKEESWVRVQPGVIRDELNRYLRPHGLFFGPNTSTADRAMIGGMVGNNSCGSYSIVYGTTRDHTLEVTSLLSDGSEVVFRSLTNEEFDQKCTGGQLENQLYRDIRNELSQAELQEAIKKSFPRPEIHRRNTGYALDALLESGVFSPDGKDFNFCNLITGSEGTLAFITEIKLNLDPLPPPELMLICPHFSSINEALRAVAVAMRYKPRAVELMDRTIIDLSRSNPAQEKNLFFIHGDPAAMLIIEFGGVQRHEIESIADTMQAEMEKAGIGSDFSRIYPPDLGKVWEVRKAGLGLLANIPGDPKAVSVIEDTAVTIEDLPDYIDEVAEMMDGFGQKAVYYAHAGAGELHLRPILNLKDAGDRKLFREIGRTTAELVKKYRGSLSGEHGDGRVRAEFIPQVMGDVNYQAFCRIKQSWDPRNIFNPGKIVDAPPMDVQLRYESGQQTPKIETALDFSETGGVLRMAEKCNGAGVCRRLATAGGTMCPSYMATRDEKDSTRARANILREFLTHSTKANTFDHPEIKEVMDLCLSCKGCSSDCPSNVDVAALKAEFLHQYYKTNGIPFRAKAIANISRLNRMASVFPGLSNLFTGNTMAGEWMKRILGMAPERTLPTLYRTTWRRWFMKNTSLPKQQPKGKVLLFADEFTNYYDVEIGIKSVQLLIMLGYEVEIPRHTESGRTFISKGLLGPAAKIAKQNVRALHPIVTEDQPLIGIEPSAILTFRDEYPKLLRGELQEKAKDLAGNVMLVDEFISREIDKGNITADAFSKDEKQILLHGHCHQKSLSELSHTEKILGLPENHHVKTIPSGCCGMAGSFGYEKEHYKLSMDVGELVLFPAVRKAEEEVIIAAPGTSCRHQIMDGTGRRAKHPVEVLWEALK